MYEGRIQQQDVINCRTRKSDATKPKPLISWRLSDHERYQVGVYPATPSKTKTKRPERNPKETLYTKRNAKQRKKPKTENPKIQSACCLCGTCPVLAMEGREGRSSLPVTEALETLLLAVDDGGLNLACDAARMDTRSQAEAHFLRDREREVQAALAGDVNVEALELRAHVEDFLEDLDTALRVAGDLDPDGQADATGVEGSFGVSEDGASDAGFSVGEEGIIPKVNGRHHRAVLPDTSLDMLVGAGVVAV